MSKWQIRIAEKQDIPKICKFLLNIEEFEHNNTDAKEQYNLWKWLYATNPSNIQNVLVAVDDQNDVIAHYGMVPFIFIKSGKNYVGGFICQIAVKKEYRKEPIFIIMSKRFLKDYRKLSIDFAYGLINRPNVLKAHLFFGFKKLGEVPVYARPYNLSSIARKYVKYSGVSSLINPFLKIAQLLLNFQRHRSKSNLRIVSINYFNQDIDNFIANIQSISKYTSCRNSEILNWRFVNVPGRKYDIFVAKELGNIVGYVVTCRLKMKKFDGLAIVDILFSPQRTDVGDILMMKVHEEAIKMNVDLSACLLNPNSPFLKTIKRWLYFKTPESFTLIVHQPQNGNLKVKESSFDEWHITWFDHDYV